MLAAGCIIAACAACSDMLETESTRQNIEPEINEKTDSVFYGYGILQAMQQLADQYVFQGEMRGDLVKTTIYTDNNLRQLANFSANITNRYDSAYVYYRVINNCNYYLAKRKTDLYTGSTNVVMNEYAAVAAIRAWAYLQLGRNYEKVPFFTEPLTKITQIDDNKYPELDLQGIVDQLAPELEKYKAYNVPTYGLTAGHAVGSPNWESTAKTFLPQLCFIPVSVVLGDMYLETGNYDQAAKTYVTYLTQVADATSSPFLAPMASKSISSGRFGDMGDDDLPDPSLISIRVTTSPQWSDIFARNSISDIISYIPMAVNSQNGCVTNIPLAFGFNYYATSEELSANGNTNPYIDEIQIQVSDVLNNLSDSTEYYYYARGGINDFDSINAAKCGDMRLRSIIHQTLVDDSTHQWIDKYKYANIVLYRTSTVLLHLAEAFNRLGMPDAAFAILKDGLSENLIERNNNGDYYVNYLSEETRSKLQTTYPLLSEENLFLFPKNTAFGIHTHGAGKAASDYAGAGGQGGSSYQTGKSPYKFGRMVGVKMKEIQETFGVNVGTTKQDTINAVEDLLCDEYALELAFEGNRYYDLMRLARHKNEAGLYDANFGSRWFARKLAYKNPAVNLEDKKNWYLPFK